MKNGISNSSEDYQSILSAIQSGAWADVEWRLAPYLAADDDAEALRLQSLAFIRQGASAAALRSLERARELGPNALVLSSLANVFIHMGVLDQAEQACRDALQLEPLPELYNTLGTIKAMQRKSHDALVAFEQALALRPDFAEARGNLINARLLAGQVTEALVEFIDLVEPGTSNADMMPADLLEWLGSKLDSGWLPNNSLAGSIKELAFLILPTGAWPSWTRRLLSQPESFGLYYEAYVRTAITAWLQGDPQVFAEALAAAERTRAKGRSASKAQKNMAAYENYLRALSQFPRRPPREDVPVIYVLGDSHVLSWHAQTIVIGQREFRLESELVMGAKAYHLAQEAPNRYQWHLRQRLQELPPHAPLLFSFGEIDCRLDSGILPYLKKSGVNAHEQIEEQTRAYVKAIRRVMPSTCPMAWLAGVPAPNLRHLRGTQPKATGVELTELLSLVRQWNTALARECENHGIGFIDVYALTSNNEGASNLKWHCDGFHLRPDAITQARWVTPKPKLSTKDIISLADQANHSSSAGRLLEAERQYRQIIAQAPSIPEVHNNLGTVLKEQGRLGEAQTAFEQAVALRPDYASAHSNLLFTLQYAPGQTLAGLRVAHEDWARQQLQGITPADPAAFERKGDGPLVVGLVSPDLYAHPVGVFLLPWLERHDRGRFQLIAYADSERDDPIARRIRAAVEGWRPIAGQDDEAVAKQIAADRVDILIDLAGHTAGNRLKLFAHRAAPIQVSWLGYPATTGVPAMDAVLMDAYTAPPGVEAGFTEQLIRLDGLRFCYTPPGYAPAVSPAPILQKGYVTFGSFNNLAKVTPEVIEAWAAILKAVPAARLVLKWKSLGDAETRDRLVAAFLQHGIDAARIECRGWSGHPQMLAEYGDIDIALDPFPFSGGLTSCDALYMGVPVLTLPGELPISRQTGSFMNALGLREWIALSREDYIDKAVSLASRADLLESLRQSLREKLLASRLCDGTAYARAIESALSALHVAKRPSPNTKDPNMKTFLHIGCGAKRKAQTTRGFNTDEWQELRFDIDASVHPDLIGTMTDMAAVADESVDAIFSSHNIEHLYPHEVPLALKEFLRVLKPDGFLVVTCPDLQSVCQLVAEDKLTEPAYVSPAGPIAPLDILYGHRPSMARGNLFMAHRCGFTEKVLIGTLQASGFATIASKARGRAPFFDLWAVASKSARSEDAMRALAAAHFPS